MLLAVHGIHDGNRSHFDDGIHFVTGLEDMHGSAGSEQDRADGVGIAQAGQEFLGNIG